MKSVVLIFLCIITAGKILLAQSIQEITTGAGYRQQSYVSLESGIEKLTDNTSWDIAFTVYNPEVAGIFINESAGTNMGQPTPEVAAFETGSDDFSEQPNPDILLDFRLYNTELNWESGAFNEVRNPDDPFDFGWGIYNSQTQDINGTRVFLIQLRNGQYKKIKFLSLSGDVFTFKYANLDGTNEVTKTINRADHAGNTLAYYSIQSDNVIDVEPEEDFDLVYERYVTLLADPGGSGNFIPYAVTGILSGLGVEVAEASGVDPSTVEYSDYIDSLQTELDVIGYDWKSFSGTEWSLEEDRVYFVKTTDDRVWKIHFTAFEGSFTGTTVFEKTDLGIISAVNDPGAAGMKALVFPNPIESIFHLSLDVPPSLVSSGSLHIIDGLGRIVQQSYLSLTEGFNVLEFNIKDLHTGLYHLKLVVKNQSFSLGMVSKQ